MTRAYLRRKLTGMAPVSLRRLALAGMVALGVACAETPEPETPDASNRGQYAKWRDQVLEWIDDNQALRTRANAGDTDAQYNLGFMYANGEGVPQDDAEAYKWLNLATTYADAEQREEFAEARDSAAEPLTPEQLAEGQKLSREWFEAHPRE